jgi:predicted secreted hydrolase
MQTAPLRAVRAGKRSQTLVCLALFSVAAGYRQALPGYHYQFPRDHFDHAEFKTEWWYYTGNVRAADGRHYGFELVFFREARHARPDNSVADNPSAWRIDDLYLAHLALTDIDARKFRYSERLNRAGPGIAGVSFEDGRIWNGNWQAQWDKARSDKAQWDKARWDQTAGVQTISAVEEGIRFTLHLTPRTAPVIHGENGVSQKAEGAGHASYYVSFPLLAVDGSLNGAAVAGTAWMDHEWFSNLLEGSTQGWDWFSAQFDNHTELMLFQVRGKEPYSSGTYVDAAGRAVHLKRSDFAVQPLDYWTSPKTGARYPVRWRVVVPSLKISVECAAAIPDQELVSKDKYTPTYWEGSVRYSGSVSGVGYLELTGYAGRARLD